MGWWGGGGRGGWGGGREVYCTLLGGAQFSHFRLSKITLDDFAPAFSALVVFSPAKSHVKASEFQTAAETMLATISTLNVLSLELAILSGGSSLQLAMWRTWCPWACKMPCFRSRRARGKKNCGPCSRQVESQMRI